MMTTITRTIRREEKSDMKRNGNGSCRTTQKNAKLHHIPNSTQASERMHMKRDDPPVFTLGSDAELFDLALDGRERFSGDAEVEELCFDDLV